MSTHLRKCGCTVIEACDGDEAVEIVTQKHDEIDIVFMDLMMPRVDGYCATENIRADEVTRQLRPIPIVAVSANALPKDTARSFEVGMNGHLAKPVVRNPLVRVLNQVDELKSGVLKKVVLAP